MFRLSKIVILGSIVCVVSIAAKQFCKYHYMEKGYNMGYIDGINRATTDINDIFKEYGE